MYAAGTWQNTAGYAARTRPCTYRIHGRARAVYRVHGRIHGRLYGPCARPCTYHVHGRVRTMYTAVHGPSMTRTRPCTQSCTLYTAVFTARVQHTARKRPCTADGHSRVYYPCTRPCTVYMHVFVACVDGRRRVQTGYGPCTWSVHDPNAAVAPTRPCLQPVPCTRPFTACTDRVHHDTVHSRHRKS